jgi:hypothetical protein
MNFISAVNFVKENCVSLKRQKDTRSVSYGLGSMARRHLTRFENSSEPPCHADEGRGAAYLGKWLFLVTARLVKDGTGKFMSTAGI